VPLPPEPELREQALLMAYAAGDAATGRLALAQGAALAHYGKRETNGTLAAFSSMPDPVGGAK
jgi:hypothetical protein